MNNNLIFTLKGIMKFSGFGYVWERCILINSSIKLLLLFRGGVIIGKRTLMNSAIKKIMIIVFVVFQREGL